MQKKRREEAKKGRKVGRKAKMQRMKRRKTFEEACKWVVWENLVSEGVRQALKVLRNSYMKGT